MQVIYAQHGKPPARIEHFTAHIRARAPKRLQIRMRPFPPINLTILQGGRCRRRVGQDMPFNAPEMRDLGTRCPGRRFLAWLIGIEFLINHAAAGIIFAAMKR
jgi:hypothetical protein